jgi:hypothetical protein
LPVTTTTPVPMMFAHFLIQMSPVPPNVPVRLDLQIPAMLLISVSLLSVILLVPAMDVFQHLFLSPLIQLVSHTLVMQPWVS